MINLVKNELIKVKISKIIFSEVFYILIFLILIKFGTKSIFELSFNLLPIVEICTCLIFGGIFSSEISSGTFRFYLTKPASRLRIYASKTLVLMGYSYISVLILIIFSWIFSSKIDLFYASKYFSYSIPVFLINSQLLYFSSKIRGKSFTICFMTLLISFSLLATQLLLEIDLKFITYTFLPYLDFSIFDDNRSLALFNKTYGIYLNIRSGVFIDTIYTIIFLIMGLISFTKKDIKN